MDALAERLGAAFGGELVRPTDASYDDARRVWNAMVDRRPALIARCRTTADVIAAVDAAREAGVELAVRGGGHGVAGHAVCDGGLVVDLSAMHGVFVDAAARRAFVQGGALLRDLDREAQRFGLATPAGTVSHTGVAGLTLGGGFGWLSRLHGLTCDNLVAAEVVTAAGEVVTAGEEGDPELLWALRGGGGNFGVVTRFDFRLHAVAAPVYTASFAFAADDGAAALAAFAEAALAAPRELTLAAWIGAARSSFLPEEWHGRPVVTLSAVHFGDPEDGARLAAPLRGVARPVAETAQVTSYLRLQRSADDGGAYGLRRYWKGHFVGSLGGAVVAAFLDGGLTAARESVNSGSELFVLGGAVRDSLHDGAAFSHRDADCDFIASAAWSDAADDGRQIAVARRAADAMAPHASGVYANDLGDEGADRVRAAYGARAYDRLVRVKDRYDPANLFRRNQNVRPTVA